MDAQHQSLKYGNLYVIVHSPTNKYYYERSKSSCGKSYSSPAFQGCTKGTRLNCGRGALSAHLVFACNLFFK